uniref:Aquaporin n=1 Tax=Chlamydomonas euryale TaxID=1486919 RepID=A0A7R9VTD3_9CHLO
MAVAKARPKRGSESGGGARGAPPRQPAETSTPAAHPPSAGQHALGDFLVMAIWVAFSSVFAEVADHVHIATGVNEVALNIVLLVAGLAAITPVCDYFWGAILNPVHNVALLLRGAGGGVATNIARMCGQLAGAIVGCLLALALVPPHHQGKFHLLSGKLKEGLPIAHGFFAEATLVVVVNLFFLYMTEGGLQRTKSKALSALAPHALTVVVVLVGAEFTGPSLNPTLSFAWNLLYQRHSMVEHLAVFWAGPLAGAVVSALVWRGTGMRSARDRAAGRAARRALGRGAGSKPKVA